MRISAKSLLLIVAALCVALAPVVVVADLCALKNGSYTLTSKASPSDGTNETATPCADADAADGTTDGEININYYPTDTKIALDVVYEQNVTGGELMVIGGFKYKLLYDAAAMTSPTCSPDPTGFFMQMGTGCPTTDDNGNDVTYYEGFDLNDTYGPDPINFVLDQITYTSGATWIDGYSYSPTFNVTDDFGATDIVAGVCFVFSGDEVTVGGCSGVTLQSIYSTQLNVDAPDCWAGPPSSAAVTCEGQAGCTHASGSADVALTYAVPTKCYVEEVEDVCTEYTGCGGYGVSFTDAAGGPQTDADGTFTETIALESGGPALTYVLAGTESTQGCSPSSDLPSSCLTTFGLSTTTSASATCKCGDPPDATLQNPSFYSPDNERAFVLNVDVSIDYVITDPDSADSGGLSNSIAQILFYYSNDGGVTITSKDVTNDMDANGNLQVKIPGYYVVADVDIYFGLTVMDGYGLSGEAPAGFDGTDMIAGNLIKVSTICEHEFAAGWNLVGTPFSSTAGNSHDAFGVPSSSTFFIYENDTYGLVSGVPDSTKGYWMHLENSSTIALSGNPSETSTVQLSQGWNVISLPADNPAVWGSAIEVSTGGSQYSLGSTEANACVDPYLYRYDASLPTPALTRISATASYSIPSWEGFFVHAHETCSLIFPE